MKRFRMSRKGSKRDFRRKSGFHHRNMPRGGMVMRGGIRL